MSDNGTGIGTTYLRIRGAADSRINVTLDGAAQLTWRPVLLANTNSYAHLAAHRYSADREHRA